MTIVVSDNCYDSNRKRLVTIYLPNMNDNVDIYSGMIYSIGYDDVNNRISFDVSNRFDPYYHY